MPRNKSLKRPVGMDHHHHHLHHQDVGAASDDEVTVVDVYDIASDIGKECEKIIDQYGADAVTALMPKVINALELLEALATRNERENGALYEMRAKIAQLEADKSEKAAYREKFERELEAIEEQWRAESKELVTVVARLQEEKRRLTTPARDHHLVDGGSGDGGGDDDGMAAGGAMLERLQTSLEKQRDELRVKDKQLAERCGDVDVLNSQVERLTATSRDLRRKHKSLQTQVRTMCDERADFLIQLQDQQRDITALRARLGLAQKENEDLVKCDYTFPSNKAVFDLDDPNRPRFTTCELKDILNERNELKARVSDLEDELEQYRPKKPLDVEPAIPATVIVKSTLMNYIEDACSSIMFNPLPIAFPLEDDEAPVQGPLPYEPDDAPWKKNSESGIKKFFRKLFSESSSGASFPRRSLSTLSKMALSATSDPVPV